MMASNEASIDDYNQSESYRYLQIWLHVTVDAKDDEKWNEIKETTFVKAEKLDILLVFLKCIF